MHFFLCTFFILPPLLFYNAAAIAVEPPWRTGDYAYYANNEALADVLKHFATDQNIPIIVSEKITEKVNANFQNMPPAMFLERLANIYDLVWFYDGRSLYVSHLNESENRLIPLKDMDVETAKQQLIELGLWNEKFKWSAAPKSYLVHIAGPPAYVDLIDESIKLLNENYRPSIQADYTAKIFRLQYALAVDRRVTFRGREEVIPGVATVLRETFGIADELSKDKRTAKQTGGAASDYDLEKLKGKIAVEGEKQATDNEQQTDTMQPAAENRADPLTSIRALAHLNAVIVYAKKSDLPLYAETIKSLDVPTDQIEIEVSIIDMSADLAQTLGVDWQLQEAVGGQVNLSTVFTDDLGRFMLRISALEEDGDARVISRPAVLTMNNEEATFDNSETFYVKLAGTEEVDLVPVSVGSLLQVRPRIIHSENNQRAVRLDIRIEDGKRQAGSQNVDSLPVTAKTLIRSQAEVAENESLLLGGHYFEQVVRSDRKIPFLGDLPIAGILFRRDTVSTQKFVRIFIITPRIVESTMHAGKDVQKRALRWRRQSELPADYLQREVVDEMRIPPWQGSNQTGAASTPAQALQDDKSLSPSLSPPQQQPGKAAPAAAKPVVASDDSRIKGWRLQSAAFEQAAELEDLVDRLGEQGQQFVVRQFDHQGQTYYRLETIAVVSENQVRTQQAHLAEQHGLETRLLPVSDSLARPAAASAPAARAQQANQARTRADSYERWVLQLGIFQNQSNAENFLQKLHQAGYRQAKVVHDDGDEQSVYMVSIDDLSRRQVESTQADIREKLKVSGYMALQQQ